MATTDGPVVVRASLRWWKRLPFGLAVGVLAFLLWTGYSAARYPDDGINSFNYNTGQIIDLSIEGPTFGVLNNGDRLLLIDGTPEVSEYSYVRQNKQSGDPVVFTIERDGIQQDVTIILAAPPISRIITRLEPLLVALIFWIIGVGVLAFKYSGSDANIFFLWCQTVTLMLTAGAASYQGPVGIATLFSFLLWLVGPISVHLHTLFPQPLNLRRQNWLLGILYIIAFAGGLPYLLFGTRTLRLLTYYTQFTAAGRLFLAMNMLLVVALLFYSYWSTNSPGVRSKIRIVFLGSILSVLPIVTLTILPEALLQQVIVPFETIFLVLGILPLTYGYAIFRLHIIEIEKQVNRGATYILVFSTIASSYLIVYAVLSRWLPQRITSSPLINTVLLLVFASLISPLYLQVQKIVDRVFYGSWYDYRSAVKDITHGIEQITDLHILAKVISERLVGTMHLEESSIFFRDLTGDFSVIEASSSKGVEKTPDQNYTVLPRSSLSFLLNIGAVEKNYLRKALSELTLSPEELQLLNSEQVYLWVPVIGHGKVLGLLALGQKVGGDIFSAEDMDILRLVVRQLGPVIENSHLLMQLREYASELEKRVAERTAELYNAKERVEAILGSVGDGVVVTGLDGQIQAVNVAFERMSGSSSQELLGSNLFEQLGMHNPLETLAEIRESLNKGVVWSGELQSLRQDNALIDIYLTLAPVRDQDGNKISYVGSQRDITRQKELDRLKDNFVSDVSHELRTPTTNISLYLELLESAPQEKHSKYFTVIKEQSQLLSKMVEDILDLSRLRMGKGKKIEFIPVDINLLVEQVIVAHRPMAEASGLQLCFEPAHGLPPARGEKNQLARVVTNLVSNAIRYTPQGSVSVSTKRSNGRVGLVIKDTGLGIDPEDQLHIFERFYRGHRVRQSGIHGTGLGLAIVKEIVDLHDGSIDLKSEIGKGTTFGVWLPMYRP